MILLKGSTQGRRLGESRAGRERNSAGRKVRQTMMLGPELRRLISSISGTRRGG